MNSIPTSLTLEQAQKLTELLQEARKLLSDAGSPFQMYKPNYASAAARIDDALGEFGVSND